MVRVAARVAAVSARFFWKKPRVARVARKTATPHNAQVAIAMARCFVRHSPTAAGARVTASRSTATASPMNVDDASELSPMEAPYCALMASARPAMPSAAIARIAAPISRGVATGWRVVKAVATGGGGEGGEGGGDAASGGWGCG